MVREETSSSIERTKQRKDINGLRGVAVTAVIFNHLQAKWLPSGHLGVDIFFVISGYVISLSLFKHSHQSLGGFLAGFYGRRVKRLIPALVTCVLLTSIVVVLLAPQPQDSLSTGKLALAGIANIYLYNIGTNYLSESAHGNAFLQTWSLGVEEQFYFSTAFLDHDEAAITAPTDTDSAYLLDLIICLFCKLFSEASHRLLGSVFSGSVQVLGAGIRGRRMCCTKKSCPRERLVILDKKISFLDRSYGAE